MVWPETERDKTSERQSTKRQRERERTTEKVYESAEAAIQLQSEILARLESQLPDKENFEKVKLIQVRLD